MRKRQKPAQRSTLNTGLTRIYKRIRKPVPPPSRVEPDRRAHIIKKIGEDEMGDIEDVRAHVYVSGHVQGVFFRATAKAVADDNTVTGWVRNTKDGRVELVFEGSKYAVESLLRWCHTGPDGSHVKGVDISWEPYTGKYMHFGIRY